MDPGDRAALTFCMTCCAPGASCLQWAAPTQHLALHANVGQHPHSVFPGCFERWLAGQATQLAPAWRSWRSWRSWLIPALQAAEAWLTKSEWICPSSSSARHGLAVHVSLLACQPRLKAGNCPRAVLTRPCRCQHRAVLARAPAPPHGNVCMRGHADSEATYTNMSSATL